MFSQSVNAPSIAAFCYGLVQPRTSIPARWPSASPAATRATMRGADPTARSAAHAADDPV
jgi:hypothetical protein